MPRNNGEARAAVPGFTPSREAPPKLAYSINDAAAVSGLSRATFYRAWRAGGGPKRLKVRKRTLITDESLRAWLRSLEYRENPEPTQSS